MDEIAQTVMQQIADGKLLGFTVSDVDGDTQSKPSKLAVSKLGVSKVGSVKQGVSQRR